MNKLIFQKINLGRGMPYKISFFVAETKPHGIKLSIFASSVKYASNREWNATQIQHKTKTRHRNEWNSYILSPWRLLILSMLFVDNASLLNQTQQSTSEVPDWKIPATLYAFFKISTWYFYQERSRKLLKLMFNDRSPSKVSSIQFPICN